MATRDRQSKPDVRKSEQRVLNWSFDEVFKVIAHEVLKYVPAGNNAAESLERAISNEHLTFRKSAESGGVYYIGTARAGESESDPVWQIQKVDTNNGTTITFADGDTEFNNIWNNRTELSYS